MRPFRAIAFRAILLSTIFLLEAGVSAAAVPPTHAAWIASTSSSDAEWQDMAPPVSPPERTNFAGVYDSVSDRMIVFGGYSYEHPSGLSDTWAYDVDSNVWTNRSPVLHPPAGWMQRAAYDSGSARTIMFGGFDSVAGTYTNETWSYDFQNNTWSKPNPDPHPSLRSRQGMAYDAESNRIVLFGGLGATYMGDTWAYDTQANQWTQRNPSPAPAARRSMGMAYDSRQDRVLLFGGVDLSTQSYFNDTWSYDFNANTWTNLSPVAGPSARYGHGFVYDAASDRSILFGGFLATGGFSNETWAYNFTDNSWSRLDTADRPQPLFHPAMAYDGQSGQTVLFGGVSPTNGEVNETWSLTIVPHAPSAPEDFSAVAGNGNVTLRWSPPRVDGLSAVTNYRLYRGPDSGNMSRLVELGNVRSYRDANVTNGVRYVYRVSAVNGIGEGPPSAEQEATPDGDPPATTASLTGCAGRAGWFTCVPVSVTLMARDDVSGVAETRYRVDGGTWQTYANPFDLTSEGVHVAEFYSVDLAGNVEAAQYANVSIDTTSPISAVGLNGTAFDAYWFRSNVTVVLTATDSGSGVASISYRLDGGDWVSYMAPFEVGEGTHHLESYGMDVAGLSEPVHTTDFGVDTTAPDVGVSVSGSRYDEWWTSPVLVRIEARDATSDTQVLFRLDGSPWTRYVEEFNVSAEGAHSVDYAVVDAVGHEVSGTIAFSIDVSPPRSRVDLVGVPGLGGWYTSAVQATLASKDQVAGIAWITYRLDGGAWKTYAVDPIVVDVDGSHVLEFFATDLAGHVESVRSVTIRIDTTPPRSTASLSGAEGDQGWYRSVVRLELQAVDASSGVASLSYRIDGRSWTPYATALDLGSGVHALEFRSTDRAGLEEALNTLAIRIDNAPPSLGGLGPSGHLTSADIVFTWSSDDGGSGINRFEVSVDGSAWTSTGVVRQAEVHLPDGPHRIQVRAVDFAGNFAETSVDVTIDTNLFSLGGSNGGAPIIGIVVIAIAILVGAVVVRRRRRR